MPKPLVDLSLKFLRETEKAIQVTEDDTNNVWLPKSQIEYEVQDDGTVEVAMPLWLAQEKKFAGY